MKERRRFPRNRAKTTIRFRIVKEGPEAEMSELVEAKMRDLSMDGIAIESPVIVADGLHVSYDEHPGKKNRVYLQWELPTGKSIKAVGETVWFERVSGPKPLFVVGLKFVEMSKEHSKSLKEFLDVSSSYMSI